MDESNKVAPHSKLSSKESNQKQREWFIDYWVKYMNSHSDEEWSQQQNILINSVLKTAMQLSREEYLKFKGERCLIK